MASNCVCCLCGTYRCGTAWAATFGLVQAIILLPLSILALLRQIWNVTELNESLPIPSLLYVYYFYNPYGDNETHTNGLALRTQILAYIYAVLNSLWLLLSIALFVKASRSRGSPWAHYTWGIVSLAIILADLIATSLYASDIFFITNFTTLSRETGYPIGNIENAPWYTFLAAPLIMMIVSCKGGVLWIMNIVFTCIVFIAGTRLSRKLPSRYSRRFVDDEIRDRQNGEAEPSAENVPVPRLPPAHLTRAASPEQNQQIRTVNEELNARLQRISSPRNFQEERTKQRSDSPRIVGPWIESPSRRSSRPVSPDNSPGSTHPSSFSFVQGPARDVNVRRTDSRRRGRPDDAESTSTWIEPPRSPAMPLSPQSPLSREPPDTWWLPSDDEPLRRPAQPKPVAELRAELRAQLPWSYFQAPPDLAVQPKSPSMKGSFAVPNIPAPDYTMHLQRGRHRSSTRELRNMPVESTKGLARSASDVGKALPYRSQQNPNVHGAPFVITDASSRSPHFLRRPTDYTGY